MSMRLVHETTLTEEAALLDVGAGASVFVDDSLAAGFTDITALDQSPIGLKIAEDRLGPLGARVRWVVADLLSWNPPRTYALWHDRAVLHFLLEEADREKYARVLRQATVSGSWVIIGVFGPEGPQMCAGLPVRTYGPEDVREVLGDDFEIQHTELMDHIRPDGDHQQYLWTLARRR